MRSMRVLMGEKRIVGELEYEDECSLISGDYDRIRQLFLILLQNAVKYADEDTKIQVNIRKKIRRILVSWKIRGSLYQKEEWENIFENFTGAVTTEQGRFRARTYGESRSPNAIRGKYGLPATKKHHLLLRGTAEAAEDMEKSLRW